MNLFKKIIGEELLEKSDNTKTENFNKDGDNYIEKLTPEEKKQLEQLRKKMIDEETSQVEEIFSSCNNKYRIAKTHSVLLKDWEKTKKETEERLKNNVLPPGTSFNFSKAMINMGDEVIEYKLSMIRMLFESTFNESIYNYLGSDGKTKSIFNLFN
ncbi:MAG: hypothetical protein PHO28_02035 [Candidatus Pacebacteria bacterium]|nr:hypothetical protein [Candidatus Paceibacterota bacterium]